MFFLRNIKRFLCEKRNKCGCHGALKIYESNWNSSKNGKYMREFWDRFECKKLCEMCGCFNYVFFEGKKK